MSQFNIGDRVRVPTENSGLQIPTGTVIDVPDNRVPDPDARLEPVRVYVVRLEDGVVRRFTGVEIEAEYEH